MGRIAVLDFDVHHGEGRAALSLSLTPTPQPQPHPEQVRPYGVSKGTALSIILERLCEQHELSEEAEGASPKVRARVRVRVRVSYY